MGIGGEYSAINSAIDELIPARVRGTVRSHRQRLVLAGNRRRGLQPRSSSSTLISSQLTSVGAFASSSGRYWDSAFCSSGKTFPRAQVAAHTRQGERGRGNRRRHRSSGGEVHGQSSRTSGRLGKDTTTEGCRIHRGWADCLRNLPGAIFSGPLPLRWPGLSLQRCLLHVFARVEHVLQRPVLQYRVLPHRLRCRQFRRPRSARSAVRCGGSAG